jgi:hypothetical protein
MDCCAAAAVCGDSIASAYTAVIASTCPRTAPISLLLTCTVAVD